MTSKDIERTIRAALNQNKSVSEISREVMGLFEWHLENSKMGSDRPCIQVPRESFLKPVSEPV